MPDYMVDAGDSTDGPVGFVARVTAKNPERALALVRDALPEDGIEVSFEKNVSVRVYFNADAVTLADVEEDE